MTVQSDVAAAIRRSPRVAEYKHAHEAISAQRRQSEMRVDEIIMRELLTPPALMRVAVSAC
eukprot:6195396-Pleurochrysis_carterae.AAC.2